MSSFVLIAAVAGYFLGALPFGYLVARAKGVNIFEVGSKSPGATNVRRVLGTGPGNLVFVLDALKGAVAAAWPLAWTAIAAQGHAGEAAYAKPDPFPSMVVGLVGALVGHSFSCFTRFKGGKGVATGAGGFLVLFPLGALISAAVWGLSLVVTRYVSLSSMLAAVALPISAWFLKAPPLLLGASVAVMLFVIIRHRTNLSRLLAGTENRIGAKKPAPGQP